MNVEHHRKIRAVPDINVTPLIDVLLVLLIIFMVLSPARPSKFQTQVPKVPESEDEPIFPDLGLVVTINSQGGYFLNQQPAETLEALGSALHGALDGRPMDSKTVFVKAPRQLDYGKVVKVIDVMKTAGCAPIGLQTEGLD